jgi:hypothetical protein
MELYILFFRDSVDIICLSIGPIVHLAELVWEALVCNLKPGPCYGGNAIIVFLRSWSVLRTNSNRFLLPLCFSDLGFACSSIVSFIDSLDPIHISLSV